MGITSSTILKTGDSKSSSRYYQIPAERRRRAHQEAVANAAVELVARELDALFPPKVGDTSTDEQKKTDTERDEEIELRFCEFMKEGGCKESFTALKDCVDEANSYTNKCKDLFPRLNKCMRVHCDYYQPILALMNSTEEFMRKEILALVLSEKEVAARKQAER